MLSYKLIKNSAGKVQYIETALTHSELLNAPKLNKGTAFTKTERATFGLIGVCLGFVLGIFKDWFLQYLKRKKEYEYLSIRVVCELDRFIYGCIDVINDNGTVCGQYDENGCARIQVEPPCFDPYSLDVEWKSLPHKLMYEILNFPNKIENAYLTNNY